MADQLMGRIEFAPYPEPRDPMKGTYVPRCVVEYPPVRAAQNYPDAINWRVVHGTGTSATEEPEGFFDLPAPDICRDARHSPPGHFVIPPGKGYRHRCPSCGRVSTIIPPQVTP